MRKFQNIMHSWMFGNVALPDVFEIVKSCGFDGLDLGVTADKAYNINNYKDSNINELKEKYGFCIPATTCIMPPNCDDISHSDEKFRNMAIDYVKSAIDATSFAGATGMLLLPNAMGRAGYHVSREVDWKTSVESVRICAEYAKPKGVSILLEPLNRHRATLVRTVKEGVEMINDVGMDNVFLVPDVYHMNNEEVFGVPSTIRQYGKYFKNFHVADSARHAPGMGVFNWGEILLALDAVGYEGPLSYEPIYREYSPVMVETDEAYRERFILELTNSVAFLKGKINALNVPQID